MTNGNWVQDPDNPEFWYWVTGEGAVLSVNGKTGEVVLTYADVGAMPDTFTESDPTVPSYVKAISQEDIDNWNAGGSGSGNPVTISEAPPEDAGEGDLWFCTLESELGLYCYDGTTWFEVGGSNSSGGGPSPSGDSSGVVISPTEPTDKFEGMLWLNSDTAEVFIFDGAVWLEFPAGSSGSGGGLWEQKGDDIYYDKGNVSVENNFTVGGTQNLSDRGTGTGKLRLFHENNLSHITSYGTDGANKGKLLFSVSDGGTAKEAMVIDGDGNVGIGTDRPVAGTRLTLDDNPYGGMQFQSDGVDCGYVGVGANTLYIGGGEKIVFHTGNPQAVDGSSRMTIDADGSVTLAHPAKIFGVRTSNNRAIQLIGYDEGTDDVSLVATNDWYVRNGSFDATLKVSATGRVDIPGTLYVNGTPKIGYSELITNLVTLRKATMDETQDIRESLRDAIDELVAGFEQEIAAMPAPEPEVSTQEIPE